MAANTLVNTVGWGMNDMCTSAQGQALQVQAAQSINRTNTITGTRAMPLIPYNDGQPGVLRITSAGIYETVAGDAAYHAFPLVGLPNGHILTAVRLWIIPASVVRGGTEPESPAFIRLYKKESTLMSGTPTLLGAQATATWGSEAAYESGQALTVSGLTETIDLNSYSYYVLFRSEDGAAAYPGLQIGGLDATVTINNGYGGADFTFWRK